MKYDGQNSHLPFCRLQDAFSMLPVNEGSGSLTPSANDEDKKSNSSTDNQESVTDVATVSENGGDNADDDGYLADDEGSDEDGPSTQPVSICKLTGGRIASYRV